MPQPKQLKGSGGSVAKPQNDVHGVRVIHIPRAELKGNPFRYMSSPPKMKGEGQEADPAEPDDER